MQTLQFGGLYRLRFNPVGRTNENLYMSTAAQFAETVALQWSARNGGNAAEPFMVRYPIEPDRDEIPEGFIKVVYPEPGKHYDVFIATDDQDDSTATSLMMESLQEDFSECFEGFFQGVAPPDIKIRLLAAANHDFYKRFIGARENDIKTINVDCESYSWEEPLPKDPNDPDDLERVVQHQSDTVKGWRVAENDDNPFRLN